MLIIVIHLLINDHSEWKCFFLSGNENDDKINATEELTPKFKGEKGESSVTQF